MYSDVRKAWRLLTGTTAASSWSDDDQDIATFCARLWPQPWMFGGRPGGWDVGHADCVYAITTGGGTGSTSSDALSLCHEGGPVALWVTIRSGARPRV